MSFPRYPKYKESGVDGIGILPEHWKVSRLSNLCNFQSGKAHEPFVDPEGTFVCVNSRFVSTEGESRKYCTQNLSPAKLNDILMVMSDLPNGRALAKAFFVDNDDLYAVNQRVCILSPLDAHPRFLFYLLNRNPLFLIHDDGVSQTHLSNATFTRFPTITPPIMEQAAIAAFLDRETAKIDALVQEQERLIELLKEKRQAVISHAVTKGLNPKAPMKDSGIEWLGQVPTHWEVRKLSNLSTKVTNGYVGPTRDIFVSEGVRYLQSLHIKSNSIQFDQPYFVSQDWSDKHAKSILKEGDLLIVQTGDIGQVAVVTEDFAGCNCHALIIVEPRKEIVTGSWLSWVLNSSYGYHSLLAVQTGALHPHLNCGEVKDVYVPVPPLKEQSAVVSYIAIQTSRTDALIKENLLAIDLLQERRTALISAAVTGKIDVRKVAAKLAQEVA